MNARDIIDRLARLDEVEEVKPRIRSSGGRGAGPAVEPAEPEVIPKEAPSRTNPPPEISPDWWDVPDEGDDAPNPFPPGKAEDDSEAIENWLAATQQPISDWDWDGQTLSLYMQDGGTESYTKEQLGEIGVFGQAAFAESIVEDEDDDKEPDDDEPDDDGEKARKADNDEPDDFEPDEDAEPDEDDNCEKAGSPCGGDSVIQGITGLTPLEAQVDAITGQGEEEGPAAQLAQGIDSIVQAIIGIVQDKTEGGVTIDGQIMGQEEPGSGELALTEPDERPDENFCPDQLAKGIEVEMEHTDDQEEAKKIAKDHLGEDTEYYVKLGQVENT